MASGKVLKEKPTNELLPLDKLINKKPKDLIPYPKNSRTHSEDQIKQIANSMKEFGFLNPVLIDSSNGIICGHGRVLAAIQLGMKEIPCLIADHLTEEQKRAYVIADNKLALNAGWDNELLKLEIGDLKALDFDISLLGFSNDELLAFDTNFEAGDVGDQGKLDELDPIIVSCPECGHEFDSRKNARKK